MAGTRGRKPLAVVIEDVMIAAYRSPSKKTEFSNDEIFQMISKIHPGYDGLNPRAIRSAVTKLKTSGVIVDVNKVSPGRRLQGDIQTYTLKKILEWETEPVAEEVLPEESWVEIPTLQDWGQLRKIMDKLSYLEGLFSGHDRILSTIKDNTPELSQLNIAVADLEKDRDSFKSDVEHLSKGLSNLQDRIDALPKSETMEEAITSLFNHLKKHERMYTLEVIEAALKQMKQEFQTKNELAAEALDRANVVQREMERQVEELRAYASSLGSTAAATAFSPENAQAAIQIYQQGYDAGFEKATSLSKINLIK